VTIRKLTNLSRFIKSEYAIDELREYIYQVNTSFRWGSQKTFFYGCGESNKTLWIDIPKNASSTFKDNMRHNNYEITNRTVTKDELAYADNVIAFARDPYKRWFSGLVEYINLREYDFVNMNRYTQNCIFETIVDVHNVDEHSGEQISYFTDIPVRKLKVWMIDEPSFQMRDVFNWIQEHCPEVSLQKEIVNSNQTNQFNKKKIIANSLNEYLLTNSREFMDHRFDADYGMIEYFKEKQVIMNLQV